MSERIHAPFTTEQVIRLNAWQTDGRVHPFTCEMHSDTPLVATAEGWRCPHAGGYAPIDVHCDYTQDWAHAFMAWRTADE